MNTQQLIDNFPGLPPEVRTLLRLAIAKRGKYKGYIRSSLPPASNPEARGAWRSLVSYLSPQRFGAMGLLIAGGTEWKAFDDCEKAIEKLKSIDGDLEFWFTFGLNAVEPPFRWNLWAHRYDPDKVLEKIQALIEKGSE